MSKYLIHVQFENYTEVIHHEGSLKDGLKKAWAICAERKSEPASIQIHQPNSQIASTNDGWQTVSPVERV